MRFEPGFLRDLKSDISGIRQEYRDRTSRVGGLSDKRLVELVANVGQTKSFDEEHAGECDVVRLGDQSYDDRAASAVRNGEVAFVVLAGGRGTRLGQPKAFQRLPNIGMTLIANKLTQSGFVTPSGERVVAPVWIMCAPGEIQQFNTHINELTLGNVEGCMFEQFESYRLQVDNRIRFNEPGVPDMYPTGHGDVGPALVESGILDENPNVKYCYIVNCDNCLATLDPIMLGHHINSGKPVTCELVERRPGDKGGVLVWNNNRLQVIEDFLLNASPEHPLFQNTNTMIIDVDVLRKEIDWMWLRTRKHVGKALIVQHERLLQQYTREFDTSFVLSRRESRYAPVKTPDDLERAAALLNGNPLWT